MLDQLVQDVIMFAKMRDSTHMTFHGFKRPRRQPAEPPKQDQDAIKGTIRSGTAPLNRSIRNLRATDQPHVVAIIDRL